MVEKYGGILMFAILKVINECLVILGHESLSDKQQMIIGRVMSGIARKKSALQAPFSRSLANVLRMDDEGARKRALLALLGSDLG